MNDGKATGMRSRKISGACGGKAPSARGGHGRRKARRKRAAPGQSPGPGRERPQQDGQLRQDAQEQRRGPAPLRKSAGPQRPPGRGEPDGPPARQQHERQRRAPPRDEPCATSFDRAPRWAAAPPVRPGPRPPPPTAPASECYWASTRFPLERDATHVLGAPRPQGRLRKPARPPAGARPRHRARPSAPEPPRPVRTWTRQQERPGRRQRPASEQERALPPSPGFRSCGPRWRGAR